jgi:hypothetical protein
VFIPLSFPSSDIELCAVDPNTKTWVKKSLEKTFGYPSIARFSWTTIKVVLDDGAHAVEWYATQFGWHIVWLMHLNLED